MSRHAFAPWEPELAHTSDEWVPCCYGAIDGPRYCTCWEPIYNLPQCETLVGPSFSSRRRALCHDCAYRTNSPERRDPSSSDLIEDLAWSGEPFFCHQGMRKVVRWEHPDGRIHVPTSDDYHPLILDRVPLRADGRAAQLCEGWRRLMVARQHSMSHEAEASR